VAQKTKGNPHQVLKGSDRETVRKLAREIVIAHHNRVGFGEEWEPDRSMYGEQKCEDYEGPDKGDLYVHPSSAEFQDEPFGIRMLVPYHVS
jgi:hypothetical protein